MSTSDDSPQAMRERQVERCDLARYRGHALTCDLEAEADLSKALDLLDIRQKDLDRESRYVVYYQTRREEAVQKCKVALERVAELETGYRYDCPDCSTRCYLPLVPSDGEDQCPLCGARMVAQ